MISAQKPKYFSSQVLAYIFINNKAARQYQMSLSLSAELWQ